MREPLVSVIIPVHNKGFFLKDTLDSVLGQTFQNFEIVIVDSELSNNAKQIVDTFEDKRIKYFYKEKAGINAARNLGIKNSRGKYIAMLEADDVWSPEKLQKQVDILNQNPQVGLVYCATEFINENKETTGRNRSVCCRGFVFNRIIMNNFLHNGSVALFRRDCLDKTGWFDETVNKMTDWDFYIRLSINYKFWGLGEYLVKSRVYSDFEDNDFEFFETCGFKILNRIFQRDDIEIRHLKHINSAYAMRYRYIGKKYYENNCLERSKGYFQEAIKRDFWTCFRSDVLPYYLLSCLPVKKREMLKKNSK